MSNVQNFFQQVDTLFLIARDQPEANDDSTQHTIEPVSVKESGDEPPLEIENTTKKEGFEWVEWPPGSGQNLYRTENTGGEWRKWPVE